MEYENRSNMKIELLRLSGILITTLILTTKTQEQCDVTTHCYDCQDSEYDIGNAFRCDGEEQCIGGDDETNCVPVFECGDYILPSPWVCDGVIDCPAGDDEVNCDHCSNTVVFHECPNSNLCLHKNLYICDGVDHCDGESDEVNCELNFECNSGEVMTSWSVCNGQLDCTSGEDEISCDHCSDTSNYYECPSSKLCLLKSRYVCDGYTQCDDKSDEVHCACDENHHFECDDGACILDELVCDGEGDCLSGEDESNCGLVCTAQQFTCLDYESCVSLSVRCDGERDCEDGSDEWYCVSLDQSTKAVLVMHQGLNSPVCSSHWNSDWNDVTCKGMGHGTALSSGTTAINTVSEYAANGFVLPEGDSSASSFMELFAYGDSCDESAVTLTCAYDACGSRSEAVVNANNRRKIVRGDDALEGYWPWQISLVRDGILICGGSLISSEWVLTAAHCVHEATDPARYSVRLGSTLSYGESEHLQSINVEQIIMHKEYNDVILANDVALVQLSEAVVVNDYVRPVCLATEAEIFHPHEFVECYTSGWGGLNKEANSYPIKLQELKTALVSDSMCYTNLQPLPYDAETMLCTGTGDYFTNACQGDSGGPLVCRSGSTNTWTQAGVVSWVVSFDTNNIQCFGYTVYAEVSHHQNWIESFDTGASFTPLTDIPDNDDDDDDNDNDDDDNDQSENTAFKVPCWSMDFLLFSVFAVGLFI